MIHRGSGYLTPTKSALAPGAEVLTYRDPFLISAVSDVLAALGLAIS